MEPREIFERAAAVLDNAVFDFQEAVPKEGPRDACFHARAERIVEVMRLLRDEPALRFDFLQNLTAVDWIKRDVIEIVYHLYSYPLRHSACVKLEVRRQEPRLPSVAAIWATANWLEREQFDLFGVVFEGHPDLRRILMPDDWVGHPMRKDFHEPRSYRGMPTSRLSPMDLLAAYDRAHAGSVVATTTKSPTSATATRNATAAATTAGTIAATTTKPPASEGGDLSPAPPSKNEGPS